ncbi:hypothetical protein [Mycolicibacterium pulveris]|uniref:hypothetical protein n=1 Tax=Mycolicibacterium pulveris TaxID=36813 RepID=UPI003CFA09EB
MTRPRPLRRFDPFRPIDMLTSLWSAAAVAPVSGATVAYRTLFTTVRRLVVGRRLTVRLEEGEVTLTVTELDSRLDARTLSVGQHDDVRLAARDIRYRGLRLTGIAFGPDVVRVSGMLPQWRIEIPPKRLEDVIGALNVVGRPLNLTGFHRLL